MDITEEFGGEQEFSLWRCEETGLLFFHPPSLEGSAGVYEGLQAMPWYRTHLRWEHRRALTRLRPGMRVLEVGCGAGAFLVAARGRGCEVLGQEKSPGVARAARDLGLPVEETALADLRLRHAGFDAVCAFQVLEHLADPLPFLRDCLACLRPGGFLLLGVPDAGGYLGLCDTILDMPPHHMLRWKEESVRALERVLPVRVRAIAREPLASYSIPSFLAALEASDGGGWRWHPVFKRAYALLLRCGLRFAFPGHTLCADLVRA